MNRSQIQMLMNDLEGANKKLYETHISYVILSGDLAYKIKKPVQFSFLDFSTLEKRKFYCEQELRLNRRLAPEMYLNVWGIVRDGERFRLMEDKEASECVEYALVMRRQDNSNEMDVLLRSGKIEVRQVEQLAQKLAMFHKNADRIAQQPDLDQVKSDYMDMESEFGILSELVGQQKAGIVRKKVDRMVNSLDRFRDRILERWDLGYYIDGHGDLHTGNIFLSDPPVVFDCIEFNDHFRKEDVLNELAFLTMDIESFGRNDLSSLFMRTYLNSYLCMETNEDRDLFQWYKNYRAGIKIKVLAIRLKQDLGLKSRKTYMGDLERYLRYFFKKG